MANENENAATITHFPPVVGVLGHVDHGKTSLLDAIRKSSIAEREFGGITQKIGASTVETLHDGEKRRITFIDTPGHEAFRNMRSRGAQAADIGLLIVSAADGVMPQTKESISLLKDAKIPYIVVLTKVDLPTKNVEKVKGEIVRENVLLEGMGGDVPVIEVSAKTGTNVKELLDLILLVQELHPKEGKVISSSEPLEAIVIESKRDPKAGAKATIIIKNGTLKTRDEVQLEGEVFKVRMMTNDVKAQLQEVTVGDAVELLGMQNVASVGSMLTTKKVEDKKQQITSANTSEVYQPMRDKNEISIILIADTEGSLEAITYSLPEDIHIISKRTGEISEADVLMAKSTGALVISFNSKIRPDVQKLAMTEKILAKNYNIIYEMIDEIKDVLEGKQLAMLEEIFGVAQIQAKFPFEKTFAMGIKVLDGRVARGDKIRIMRGEESIGESTLSSLRINKNSASKVEKGHEAGVIANPYLDFQVGDVIICHS